MKRTKVTALILAATALFAACSESDLITAVVQEDIPIGFSTGFVDCITRAEMTTTTLNTDNNTFMVWGWKTAGTTETKVFNGTTVTYDSNSSQKTTKWVYSPLKYWDRTASYNFYAASPADTSTSSTVFTIDNSTKKISAEIPSSNYIQVLYQDGDTSKASSSTAVDYLVAAAVNCNAGKDNQGNASDKDVAFTFKHILSKFNVKVKTTTDFTSDPQIFLKQLYVYAGGMCKEYSQTKAGTVSISDTWSTTAKDAYTTTPTGNADMTCYDKAGNDSLLLTSTTQDVASYLVCPTATADGTADNKVFVKAIYVLVYEEGDTEPFETEITEVLNLKSGATAGSTDPNDYEPALPKFQQGYSYDLTVTVAPSAIYFDVESVSGFTAGTVADITVE